MKSPYIIAIDGFSSCGKSTLAKELAKKLNFLYVDSGAMYRAVTYYLLENGIVVENNSVKEILSKINIDFRFNTIKDKHELYLNNINIEEDIRKMRIASMVSPVATLESVRKYLVNLQQQFANEKSLVMDGRDIGTVVFPNANLKIFLTADFQERVQRRYAELIEKGDDVSLNEIEKNLSQRDLIDSTREIAPLRKADDAVVIDNTYLTREEQLEQVLEMIENKN